MEQKSLSDSSGIRRKLAYRAPMAIEITRAKFCLLFCRWRELPHDRGVRGYSVPMIFFQLVVRSPPHCRQGTDPILLS